MAQSVQIHLVEFHDVTIETTVTDKASVAQNWIQQINRLFKDQNRENIIIGMDCKYIRHPIGLLSRKIALLQLCVNNKCLVLQLLHMDHDIPQSVRDFLNYSKNTVVGVEVQEKSRKLLNEYGLDMGLCKVDVHFLAKSWFPLSYGERPSLKALAYGIAGISLRKTSKNYVIVGDWESRRLDEELVERACVDAYATYAIAHKLLRDF